MADGIRFERRMSDSDALLWRIEKDPQLRSTITAISVFDRPADRERVLDRFELASRTIPRLRQRVVSAPFSPAPPRWVVDPDFDLSYHLRWVQAPGGGTLRDLLDLAQPLAMQGFDRARPLWEFTVVEGLAGGRSGLVQKVHHSVTDGVGGVELAMTLLDLERDPAGGPPAAADAPPVPAPERLGWLERVLDSAEHERRRALGIASRALGNVGRTVGDPAGGVRRLAAGAASGARLLAPAFEPLSPVLRGRSTRVHFDALSVPLGELKAGAKAAGGTLNDGFVAGVAGGLRRYHVLHGAPVDGLRMTMPINVRTEGDAGVAGNRFVPARFVVPVGVVDPTDRVAAVRSLVGRQRSEPSLGFSEGIAGAINRLGTTAATELFGRMLKGVDFVTSNVPGAPVPVYFAGGRLEAQFPFGPLSGAALNVTLLSYLDECHVGVNTDAAAVPDPDALLTCLEEGFDEVRKLA